MPAPRNLGAYFSAATLILVLTAPAPGAPIGEPTYQGRTVADWVEQLTCPNAELRVEAAEALARIEPAPRKAVPALREALVEGNWQVVRWETSLWSAAALLRIEPDDNDARRVLADAITAWQSDVRLKAVTMLGVLGPKGTSFIPALIAALKDPSDTVRLWAAAALLSIDQRREAREVLVAALKDDDSSFRLTAVLALASIGPAAECMRSEMAAGLEDENHEVRYQAAAALLQIDPKQPKLLALFRAALSDRAELSASHVVHLLGQCGPVALPLLREALESKDRNLREWAAWEIVQHRPVSPDAIAAIGAALQAEQHPSARVDLAWSLLKADPRHKDAHAVLMDSLKNGRNQPNGHGQSICDQTLYNFRKVDVTTVPFLMLLMRDGDDELRQFAAGELLRLGRVAKSAVPALVNALQNSDPKTRLYAAAGLLRFDAPEAERVLWDFVADRDAARRRTTAGVLRDVGPKAIAMLSCLNKDADKSVRETATLSLIGVGQSTIPLIIESLRDPDLEVREAAQGALTSFGGPKGRPYIPALLELLKSADEDSRGAAIGALMHMGSATYPGVKDLLRHKDRNIRMNAALYLEADASLLPVLIEILDDPGSEFLYQIIHRIPQTGPKAVAAAPALARILKSTRPELTKDGVRNPHADVGEYAARMLALIEPMALFDAFHEKDAEVRAIAAKALEKVEYPSLTALIDASRNQDVNVRLVVVSKLKEFGPKCLPAAPALIERLGDSNEKVRETAAEALGRIGRKAAPAVLAARADPDSARRAWVMRTLGNMPVDAGAVVPTLVAGLKDPNAYVRFKAAAGMLCQGPKAKAALPDLLEAVKDGDSNVSCQARHALVAFASCVEELAAALKDKDPQVRCAAAEALYFSHEAVTKALPALIEAVQDKDGGVRSAAIDALGKAGPNAAAAVPALANVVRKEKGRFRFEAASALRKIGSPAAVPALIEAVKDTDPKVREEVIAALGCIGPPAKAAVPVLKNGLTNDGEGLRLVYACALVRIDRADADGIAALTTALRDEKLEQRQSASFHLTQLGPEGKAFVPILVEALQDEDGTVRSNAIRALRKIDPETAKQEGVGEGMPGMVFSG